MIVKRLSSVRQGWGEKIKVFTVKAMREEILSLFLGCRQAAFGLLFLKVLSSGCGFTPVFGFFLINKGSVIIVLFNFADKSWHDHKSELKSAFCKKRVGPYQDSQARKLCEL